MVRGLGFTAGLTVLIALVLLVPPTYCSNPPCAHSSSCGNIPNISFPFRLNTDPQNCGDSRYVLSCDENNRTVLYLHGGKYYVQEISYNNYTIRMVDSSIRKDNYFSLSTPTYSLSRYNFSSDDPYTTYQQKKMVSEWYPELSRSLVWMSCEKPVNSPLYLDTYTCNYNDNSSSISDSKRYRYVKVGETSASQVEDSCQVEKMFLTSWPTNNDDQNISCTDVHNELVYGFELSWLESNCESYCGRDYLNYCYLNDTNHLQCIRYFTVEAGIGLRERILYQLEGWLYGYTRQSQHWWNALVKNGEHREYRLFWVFTVLYTVLLYLATKIVLGIPCVVAFLIYKWRRRHLSMYDAVEDFLQSQINLMPIRYSYSKIRKMSKGFKGKLGEGGYGTVYKGKLESGTLVAIKMLGSSKTNGQEFINEVATIGRIHHVNVVQLIGFCAKGSKRALIYEFMSNGSLEKYIFSQEESIPLSIEKTYDISLGVARGIEYLH